MRNNDHKNILDVNMKHIKSDDNTNSNDIFEHNNVTQKRKHPDHIVPEDKINILDATIQYSFFNENLNQLITKIVKQQYMIKQLGNGQYTIVDTKTGDRLVGLNGKEIGNYDYIDDVYNFAEGKATHCFVSIGDKVAILDIVRNEIVTKWDNYEKETTLEEKTEKLVNNILDNVVDKILHEILHQDKKIAEIFPKNPEKKYYEYFPFNAHKHRQMFNRFLQEKGKYYILENRNKQQVIFDILANKIITDWYNLNLNFIRFTYKELKYCQFKLSNNKYINFNFLDKIYQDSLLDKFIITVGFKKNLWEYWYKCF